MEKMSKIYVVGYRGLVGLVIVRKLLREGYNNLVFKIREEFDLID